MINDILISRTDYWEEMRKHFQIIATSGGFDPLHIGHLRSILDMRKAVIEIDPHTQTYLHTVVIVNGPNFLKQKKGYEFMPLEERMEIILNIKGVDEVVTWDQEGNDSSISEALKIIRPHFFCKGGDRTQAKGIAEEPLCKEIGCKIIWNVGGGKIQSSSTLVNAINK